MFNEEQLIQIIGGMEVDRVRLRMTVAQMQARIAELESKYEPKEPAKPELKAVSDG